MTPPAKPSVLPSFVKEVTGDVQPDYWEPQSLAEWAEIQTTTVFLGVWEQQQAEERSLRKMIGIWVFILITLQVFGVFALVLADSMQLIAVDTEIVKLLIPSVLAEVFGMGFVVVKYLFTASTWNPLNPKKRR